MIMLVLGIKPCDIVRELNYSSSAVSRYLNGERDCIAIDFWFIEKVFGIKVEDYSKID